MSDKKIFISGKKIDYGNLSNDKLLVLYQKLIKRQISLQKKAAQYIENNKISDININDVNI